MTRLDPLSKSLGYHVYRLHDEMLKRFTLRLKPYGVSPAEWSVLQAIGRRECHNAAEISRSIGRDRAAISRTLNTLIDNGLVLSRPESSDARVQALSLSRRAHELLPHLEACSADINQEVLSLISASEGQSLLNTLQKIIRHLE